MYYSEVPYVGSTVKKHSKYNKPRTKNDST